MYVKVYCRHNGQWDPIHVVELNKTQLKHQKRMYPNRLHLVIAGPEAHKWVRDGRVHGTYLYVDPYDNNRIRRARDAR